MADRDRIKELLDLALRLRREDRGAFLARECRDADERREVEELLAAFENSRHLHDSVAFGVGSDDETIGKVLGGKYLVVGKLGEGGMGQVYLAEDETMPRKVAIKIFDQGYLKEVEALSRIKSDRVVDIIGKGETDDGRPYMVMELLNGKKLSVTLEERGLLPHAEVAQLMRELGIAATDLHETKATPDGRGIVHRDLKPSNVMVKQNRRGDWELKLFDFGIARLDNPLMGKSTSRHVMIGTPLYMAPEQFHGPNMADFGCQAKALKDVISPATDVYALGVIAFEMLTGRHPFGHAISPANVAIEQQSGKFAEALGGHEEIPADARAAVLKAMSFCPESRFQNAEEFGDRLAKALTEKPVEQDAGVITKVPPPTPSRRGLYAAAALVLLLLLGGGLTLYRRGAAGAQNDNSNRAVSGNANGGNANGDNANGVGRAGGNDNAPPAAPRAEGSEVACWLVTQQMRGGQLVGDPKVVTSQEGLTTGWSLKFFVNSAERGHLYLLNDGPAPRGRSLQVLFPVPADPTRRSSEVAPGEPMQAFSLRVGKTSGAERLWVVWSKEKIPQLEKLTQYTTQEYSGVVDEGRDGEAARAFLAGLKQAELTYDSQNHAILRGEGGVLIREILLKHV